MSSELNFESLKINDDINPLKITLSKERNQQYCKLIKEINPLHFDLNYAKKLGYRNIVVAGIFTATFFIKTITDWIGNKGRILDFEIIFKNPAYIDDTLVHEGKIIDKKIESNKKIIICEVSSKNQLNEKLATAIIKVEII
ncbi:MAG: MaoC family dehydratase [Promethearchaeota archaeon]